MDRNSLNQRIFTYSDFLKNRFGGKVFRVGLSIGKTCPHRLSTGGCIFCNPKSFTGHYQRQSYSVKEQLKNALPTLRKCCGNVKFLAYFQDETSTACTLEEMKEIIEKTISEKEIVGIILSTRPDYMKADFVNYFASLSIPFSLEIGLQTIHDKSLQWLKRGHTFSQAKRAIELCGKAGIEIGVHLILGIPGETIEDMKETIRFISENPYIKEVKFHNLVVYKDTQLAVYYQKEKFPLYTIQNHIDTLTQLLPLLRGDIVVTRLFTSNIINSEPTIYPYSGNKTKWMNQLRIQLINNGIIQGMDTENPFKKEALAV